MRIIPRLCILYTDCAFYTVYTDCAFCTQRIFCKTFATLDTDEFPVDQEAETDVEVSDSDDDWASDTSEVSSSSSSVMIFESGSNDDVLESIETDLNQVLYSTPSLPSSLFK